MAQENATDNPDVGDVTAGVGDTGPATGNADGADTGGSGGSDVMDATPGLGGVGAGDPGGLDPQAPIVNDEDASGPAA